MEFGLSSELLTHTRKTYDVFQLFGELGGILEVAMITFQFLLSPLAQFLFEMKAIKTLYLAKTKDELLF